MITINKENKINQGAFEEIVERAAVLMFKNGKTPSEKFDMFEGWDGPGGTGLGLIYNDGKPDEKYIELDYDCFASALKERYVAPDLKKFEYYKLDNPNRELYCQVIFDWMPEDPDYSESKYHNE